MMRVKSMSLSVIITILFVTLVTIFGELCAPLKDFLKLLTGHHWITKSVLSVMLFFGSYFFIRCSEKELDVLKEAKKVILFTILGIILLFAFFVWHYFYG